MTLLARKMQSISKELCWEVHHEIKINGMLPLDRDKSNLPYPNTSEKISDGWYVQGNISNRDRVKRLQQIGECLGLDMEVEMVKPQDNNQGK